MKVSVLPLFYLGILIPRHSLGKLVAMQLSQAQGIRKKPSAKTKKGFTATAVNPLSYTYIN
jgi:hypothetical protein